MAEEQNNISFSDVSPNHWAYQALTTLANKYNFKLGYPDGTFKGEKNLSRYEVAALIVEVMKQLENKKIEKTDIKIIKKLESDFDPELASFKEKISGKLQNLEDQLDILEIGDDQQTTVLDKLMEDLPFVLSGDLGFRYQLITSKPGDYSNQVPQTRIGLSINSRNSDKIGYGVRILSGAANRPGNSWWKLADFFAKVPLNFDRFFVTYKPVNFFELTLGKFRDPFANTEIYFDEEINPQGALQTFKFRNLSFLNELSFNLGEIIINMDQEFGNTFSLNGNSDLKINLSDFIDLNLRAGYYHYIGQNNIAQENKISNDKKLILRRTGNINTNTLDGKGNYKTNFNIFNGFAKFTFKISDNFPLAVSGDYLNNLGASLDKQAFQFSAKIGTIKEPGNFFVGYNFKYLQTDATIALFVEDQLGSTDIQAHEGIFGIKILEKTILSTTFQAGNRIKTQGNSTYTLRVNLIQGF